MSRNSRVTSLYRAMKDRDDAAFDRLLTDHPRVVKLGADGCVPPALIAAAGCGTAEQVRRILELGADPEVRDHSGKGATWNMRALEMALWFERDDVVRVLEEAGAVEDFGTWVFRRDVKKAAKALDADPSLIETAYMRKAFTLLHVSATFGHAGLTKLFLERGCDPTVADESGHLPLRFAARNDPCLDVMELLVDAGSDVNHRSRTGITALSAACRHRDSMPSVRWLLERGADPNNVPDDRKSPLIKAAANRVTEMAALLLEHGADPSFEGPKGETALDVAKRRKAADIVTMLEEHGG